MADGDARQPSADDRVYMIAGTDAEGDCHTIFTDSAMRAIGHFKRMTATLDDIRGNENFELLRPIIAQFDTDRDEERRA